MLWTQAVRRIKGYPEKGLPPYLAESLEVMKNGRRNYTTGLAGLPRRNKAYEGATEARSTFSKLAYMPGSPVSAHHDDMVTRHRLL